MEKSSSVIYEEFLSRQNFELAFYRIKHGTNQSYRPEFQHMIKDSYKHAFDCIIVWKLDRFARNRYDSAYYKNVLKKNGVRVISAKESISQGADGILLESILEGFKRSNGHNISNLRTKQPIQCKVKAIGDNIRWLLS